MGITGVEFPEFPRFLKKQPLLRQTFTGVQEDSTTQGNGDEYKINGGGVDGTFGTVGIFRQAGTFRNLSVHINSGGNAVVNPIGDSEIGIREQAGGSPILKVGFGEGEEGTKENKQDEYHINAGAKVVMEISAVEGDSGTISKVSWSVDFDPDT